MLFTEIELADYEKAGSAINKQTLLSNILDKSYNQKASLRTLVAKNDRNKTHRQILTMRYGKRVLGSCIYNKDIDGDFETFRAKYIEHLKKNEAVQDAAWDMFATLSKMNTDNAAKSKAA